MDNNALSLEKWPRKIQVEGYGDRVFLTKQEWEAYWKRTPVRYLFNVKINGGKCFLGKDCSTKNGRRKVRLEKAHRIPFREGVLFLGLTPDFLNRKRNIVRACKGSCNNRCVLTPQGCLEQLKKWLDQDRKATPNTPNNLPCFVPEIYRKEWQKLTQVPQNESSAHVSP